MSPVGFVPGERESLAADYSDELFRSLFEKSRLSIARLDQRLQVVQANSEFFRLFGRLPEDMRERRFLDLMHPSVSDALRVQFSKLIEGRCVRVADRIVGLRPDDSVFGGELTAVGVPGSSGRCSAVITLINQECPAKPEEVLTPRSKKPLTEMDARVLEGVAAGISTVQIAASLYLSRGGVEYHVNALLRKLKVPNRPALVSKAYSLGLFKVGSWPPKVLPEFVK